MPALPHAEFPECVDSKIAEAVLRIFREDSAYGHFFRTITDLEEEDLWLSGSIGFPALGVSVSASEEVVTGNDYYAEHRTELELYYLIERRTTAGTDRFLRTRLIDHGKRLLWGSEGILHDGEGNRLTEAVLDFARVPFTGALRVNQNVLVTRARVTYRADVESDSREFIE